MTQLQLRPRRGSRMGVVNPGGPSSRLTLPIVSLRSDARAAPVPAASRAAPTELPLGGRHRERRAGDRDRLGERWSRRLLHHRQLLRGRGDEPAGGVEDRL